MLKWFANLKISRKLIYGFLVGAIITVIVGVLGISSVLSMNQTNLKLYQENSLGLQYAGEAAVDFQQLRYDMLKLRKSEGGTQSDIDAQVSATKESSAVFADSLEQCKIVFRTGELKTYIENFDNNWRQYSEYVNKYIEAASKNDFGSLADISSPASALGTTIRDDFTSFFNFVSQRAAETSGNTTQASTKTIITLIATTAAGLVVSLLLGYWISKQLSYPLGRIATVADMLSKGDVNLESFLNKEDYEYKFRKDEIGTVALAFNQLMTGTIKQVAETKKLAEGDLTTEITVRSDRDVMGEGLTTVVNNFNDLVSSIISSVVQVESGSNLVANSSAVLSQGATEQASSIQELTASLEEISSQTVRNAQNAETASQLATNAKTDAENGNLQMRELLKAMDMINASSGNIGKIIKVIDDIAFQTNILALNAAVEAARAGQHGKGFAVVAEEVRTLAARSASAARETTDMIEGSIRSVETGIKIANQTAEALQKIVSEVTNATDLVGSIAVASKEQASSIEQLNQGISQVSQVVQHNAATSEESAAASEELASQAGYLKEIISSFKVKESRGAAPAQTSAPTKAAAPAPRALPAGPAAPKISLEGEFGKY
jgi:methyl-accepting chemotaxis protein